MNVALPSTYRFMEKVIQELNAMYQEAGLSPVSYTDLDNVVLVAKVALAFPENFAGEAKLLKEKLTAYPSTLTKVSVYH